MQYRKLGNTGYDVSALGFGTWQLGGGRWHRGDDAEAIRLLREAHSAGINIFDAAAVYGQYRDINGILHSRSLQLLGQAFENHRSEVIYCVKVGQFDEYSHRSDFTPHRLVEQLTYALKQLKTDYIDICLIHAPSLATVESGNAISVLLALQAMGVVRAVGYSFENEPGHLQAALNQPIDVVMHQYNLFDRDCSKLFDEAIKRGIALLAGGPLKRGYLTGNFLTPEDLPRNDDYWRWNLDKNPQKVTKLLQKVSEEIQRFGSPRQLRRAALQFILEEEAISSAIVGHRSLNEVQENLESIEKGIVVLADDYLHTSSISQPIVVNQR